MGTSVLVFTMAGAGQPWYMPLTWPLGHVATAITKEEGDKPLKNAAVPYLDITGNFTAMAAAARSWTLAYLCIYYLPQKFGMVYPAFGPAKEPHSHLGHLWLLGLVPLLLPYPAEAPQVQDEPSLPLLQPDQARCHGDNLCKLCCSWY